MKNIPWVGTTFQVGGDAICEARELRWADLVQRWGLTRSAVEKTKYPVPGTTYREAKRSVRVF